MNFKAIGFDCFLFDKFRFEKYGIFAANNETESIMKLKRTFHAVGQGAFYSESFFENEKNVFNAVYDCGTSNYQKDLVREIHIAFPKGSEIDYLFISHFHCDHTSGIKELDKWCRIKRYIIPVVSPQMLAESAIHDYLWVVNTGNRKERFDELLDVIRMIVEEKDPIQIGEENNNLFPVIPEKKDKDNSILDSNSWIYIPYNPCQNPISDILDELKKNNCNQLVEAFEKMDFDAIEKGIKEANLDDLKLSYKNAFEEHHSYVMPVYSGYRNPQAYLDERICLYTGDYDASDLGKVRILATPLGNRKWDAVGTFQVPHHGSKDNSCQELYEEKKRMYVISSFGPSKYGHPHGETIGYICNNNDGMKLQLVGNDSTLPSFSRTFNIW